MCVCVYFYILRACEFIVGACLGMVMFHSTYHLQGQGGGEGEGENNDFYVEPADY